jgi:hypothetical protein
LGQNIVERGRRANAKLTPPDRLEAVLGVERLGYSRTSSAGCAATTSGAALARQTNSMQSLLSAFTFHYL